MAGIINLNQHHSTVSLWLVRIQLFCPLGDLFIFSSLINRFSNRAMIATGAAAIENDPLESAAAVRLYLTDNNVEALLVFHYLTIVIFLYVGNFLSEI